MAAPFPEKFGNTEKALEKAGQQNESVDTRKEAMRVVATKPKAIKRKRHRAATALAASNTVFNQAVLELQGLSMILRDVPHEFLIKKILGIDHLKL